MEDELKNKILKEKETFKRQLIMIINKKVSKKFLLESV